ncbi:MAG: single-stranded-DNA-specific exonuclease RecJ [Candidatus Babeliaceae bacterium]|nr:single-stranded-DNA-specific exonuclease RecJ [Candidatus Babeliaceae bacterium]
MMTIQGLKYRWNIPDVDGAAVAQLAADVALPVPLAHALYARGFTRKEQLQDYLISSYEKDVADPQLLKDAQKAVDRLIQALNGNEKILIAGDYDVDGITSSALMMICLLPLGAQVNFFLPNRVKDGYGLSVKTVERAHEHGYAVIITVDNGISAFKPAERAQELGVDLIITDHHRPHGNLPCAYAIVDPHQEDCAYPYKYFAGVGVSFKLMALLYAQLGKQLPAEVYELMLLGTVADVVPLTGENRFWVRHGLQKIKQGHSYGLQVLKRNARVTKETLTSLDIGFFITPQINALGRLEDARSGVKFLVGNDTTVTEAVGTLLHKLNEERKFIEKNIYENVLEKIKQGLINPHQDRMIIVAHDDWPTGVIGLVAGKLMNAYNVPTILLHRTVQGILKGSCRSIGECDIFKALSSVKDLLISFGGHPMAAGLALDEKNFDAFKKRLSEYITEFVTHESMVKKITCDAPLLLTDVTQKLSHGLQYLEPFGCENPQPLFILKDVTLLEPPQLLKEQHVKARLFSDGVIKPIIFFNRPDLFEWFIEHQRDIFSVACYVTQNNWNDKISVELQGVDISCV